MWITYKHTTNFEYFAPWGVLVSSPCRSDIRVKKKPVKTNDSASGKDCKENLKLYWVGSLSNDIQLYTINQIYKTLRLSSTSRLNFVVKNVKGSCKDYFGRKQVTAQIHHHCESNFINSLGYARQWHVAIQHKFDILLLTWILRRPRRKIYFKKRILFDFYSQLYSRGLQFEKEGSYLGSQT